MSPREISQLAMSSIEGELRENAGRVKFKCGNDLLKLFENHYSEYLLLKSGLLTSYVSTLRQAFEDSGPLHHLSLKHGMLGLAKRGTARAYVKPQFEVNFREVEGVKIKLPNLERLSQTITANQLDDLGNSVRALSDFFQDCADESCSILKSAPGIKTVQMGMVEIWQDVEYDWENEFDATLERRQKKRSQHERQLIGVELRGGRLAQGSLSHAVDRAQQIVNEISRIGGKTSAICAGHDAGLAALSCESIQSYNLCSDFARAWPQFIRSGKRLKVFEIPETLLAILRGLYSYQVLRAMVKLLSVSGAHFTKVNVSLTATLTSFPSTSRCIGLRMSYLSLSMKAFWPEMIGGVT